MTDLPWSESEDEPNLGAPSPRPCRHPKDSRHTLEDGGWVCGRCSTVMTPETIRRGKSARRRGIDYERELAWKLGGTKVGHFGGAADVIVNEMFVVQSKVGLRFPGWMQDELNKLPRTGGRIPLLVVADAGSGHKRRAVVVLGLDDWRDLHVGG